MNLRMNVAKINEKRRIVLGEVISVKPGSNENVVNVELKGVLWNTEEKKEEEKILSIAFWNNDTVKMADRIAAAKVKEGSILTVDIYDNDGKISGNNFKYQGHWVIPATEEAKERNVFMGTVILHEDPDGRFVRVSMPVQGKGDEEPTWASITFWNNESSNLADRAKKVLGEREGKKAKAVIICGENKPYNEKPSYNAYDFILLPR
jgi:hypothetical protein